MKTNYTNTAKIALAAFITLTMTACTSMSTGADHRPIVDGGDLTNYESDLAACKQVAEQRDYVNDETKSDALIGAGIGAISGADGNSGDIIGGAIVGAVVGAGSKAYEVRSERKQIVINCMRGRGYNTVE